MVITANFPFTICLGILLYFPFLLVLVDTFFRAIYLTVAEFSRKPNRKKLPEELHNIDLLILVVAHNEQRIIAQTLGLIQSQIMGSAGVDLALLADNCSDETLQIAIDSGVKAFVRLDNNPGKGKALSWLVAQKKDDLDKYDLIAILDADTIISSEFCNKIRSAFYKVEIQAIQVFIEPLYSDKFSPTILAAYSEILSQKIDDDVRSHLGWTIPLRGTGMVFRREVFSRICVGLETQVDDIELSIRLARIGITVFFAPEAIIYDPKSSNMLDLARQRGRWLKGQRQIFSLQIDDLMKLIISGLSGWSLIQALLFKPKTLLLMIKFCLVLAIWYFTTGPLFYILEISLLGSILIDLLYYFIGLKYVSEPKIYLFALLKAPLYFVLWFTSWLFSIIPGKKWLRARD